MSTITGTSATWGVGLAAPATDPTVLARIEALERTLEHVMELLNIKAEVKTLNAVNNAVDNWKVGQYTIATIQSALEGPPVSIAALRAFDRLVEQLKARGLVK